MVRAWHRDYHPARWWSPAPSATGRACASVRRPDRPELEIIKRITAIDAGGAIVLEGDNPAASTDSRQFGPVTRAHIVARVRWRYWPLPPARL